MNEPYKCPTCGRIHAPGSKIYDQHHPGIHPEAHVPWIPDFKTKEMCRLKERRAMTERELLEYKRDIALASGERWGMFKQMSWQKELKQARKHDVD